MQNLSQVPDRYRHLAQSDWDLDFLSKPAWVSWLDSQVNVDPIAPGVSLVTYVRIKVAEQKASLPPAPATAPAPAPSPVKIAPSSPAQVAPSVSYNTSNGMNGATNGDFSDMLDLTSYAGEDSSSTNGYADDGMASTSAAQNLYSAYAVASSRPSPTPSPMAAYAHPAGPGAIAPFSQPGAYAGPVTPFTSQPTHGIAPPYASSTLALQGQLISEERQRSAAAAAAAAAGVQSAFLNAQAPQSFYQPQVYQQPALTITPSALSTLAPQPVASTSKSTSSAPKPSSSSSSSSKARAASPAPATAKRSRTASPDAAASYDSTQWTIILPKLRQHLNAKRLTGAALSSAQFLVKNLALFSHIDKSSTLSPWGDASDVPPEGRAEVLSQILKYGKDDFWKAWLEFGSSSGSKGKEKEGARVRSDGLELLQRWLEGAAKVYARKGDEKESKSKDKKQKELEQATLAYVLQALLKLPVKLDHLVAYPCANLVLRLSKRVPEGAARAAAAQLVTKWKKVQDDANAKTDSDKASSSAAKRKSDAAEGPAKKPKTAEPAKKPTLPIKEKVALPTFGKKKDAAPAAPVSAFAAAMQGLKGKEPAATPARVTPAPPAPVAAKKATAAPETDAANGKEQVVPSAAPGAGLAKNGKKKKSVRWKEGEDLEAVKYIDKAVYDGDEVAGGEDTADYMRDMNMQEGQTLQMHLDVEMDEDMEWYEPIPVEIPDTEDFASFREEPQSEEVRVQTAREAATMAIDATSTPPDSPGEDQVTDGTPLVTGENKAMVLHQDLVNDESVMHTIELAQAKPRNEASFAENDQIESLLGQLSGFGGHPPPAVGSTSAAAAPPAPIVDEATRALLQNYPADHVQRMIETNPQFAGLTLEALGMAPPHPQGPQQYPPQHPASYDAAPPQPYGQHAPPPHNYGPPPPGQYHPAGLAYQQTWQPPPAAPYNPPTSSGWIPPQPNYAVVPGATNNYQGYQPPNRPTLGGHTTTTPTPVGGFRAHKKDVPCRFFYQPRGCDRGELCLFKHG
ncbi:hypothetical protein JCM10213_003778 [Rhodosporidiobolus nylandii]